MKNSKLEGFINRYNLGGEIESVLIKSTDKGLSVKVISDDKTLLGNVTLSESDFPHGEFGVYTTSQLKALLGVLDDNIQITEGVGSLKFSDNATKMQYMLANSTVIPAVPELKTLPEFDTEITLNDDFVNKFIKSKSALSDADVFTFMCKDGKGEIVLGYSTINSNRVSIAVECTSTEDIQPIGFSAKYLKAILVSNKGSTSASLKVASKGLAHLSFTFDEYTAEYFLVEVK
jgi:hypothetical protein